MDWQEVRRRRRYIARVKFRLGPKAADAARHSGVAFSRAATTAGFDAAVLWPELLIRKNAAPRCPHCNRIWKKKESK